MVKDPSTTANIYTMTLNLFAGDQFQFTDPQLNEETGAYSWGNQRGAGYMESFTLEGTEYFSGGGGLSDDTSNSNITALVAGQYKFTLTTYPAQDFQLNDSPELYNNRNYYDTLTWERLGDPTEDLPETSTTMYIKGEMITSWGDYLNDHTIMTATSEENVVALNGVYLKAEDQFMFASRVTNLTTGESSAGNVYIRGSNLDEASKALVTGEGNMKVVTTGYYDFKYNTETTVLTVTQSTYTLPSADYYLDGSFCSWGGAGNDTYKMAPLSDDNPEVLGLSAPVTLAVDDQIGIQFYEKGAESPYKDFFGSGYVVANEAFDLSATNPKCLVAGSYNITINTYSHLISIASAA